MVDAAALLKAVEGIYGAVLAPEGWPSAVETIADLLKCDHALMVSSSVQGEPLFQTSARVDPWHVTRLASPEAVRLASRLRRDVPVNIPVCTETLVTTDEAAWREYYNEFLRPMNGSHALAALPRWSNDVLIDMGFCRRPGSESFGSAEVATLQALLPHLANALEIQLRLQAANQEARGAQQLLDRLNAGVVLVDEAGQPCFINQRALKLLNEADGLVLSRGRLIADNCEESRALRRAIAITSAAHDFGKSLLGETAGGRPPQRIRIRRPSRRAPLALTVSPIGMLGMTLPGARTPRAAIWITEPDAPPALDDQAASEAFRLTRREAAVATLLARGFDLKSAAAALGIKPITARNHLKRAFEKANVHSQTALVTLIRGLADPLN